MKKLSLTTKILIGLIVGIAVGIFLHPLKDSEFVQKYMLNFTFDILGNGFVRIIRMVVVPLVFCSLIVGAAGIEDIAKLGRVGIKTLSFYLFTTAIAVIIGIGFANVTNPGLGLNLSNIEKVAVKIAPTKPFSQILLEIIPMNPIESMVKGDMLGIIFFAIMFGIAIAILGKGASNTRNFFEETNNIMLKIVEIVMFLAPFGVFGLIAKTFTTLGYSAIVPLMKYFLTVIIALLIHTLVTYQGLLVFFAKYNPIKFFKNFVPAMIVGFSTSSSAAALPTSLKTMQENFKVSKTISSFTIPLGSTINMDGTAIMQGVAAVFIAQVYGVDLTMGNYITIILTATLASIGTAGVPGVGIIMLGMVLTSVGLPIEGIALIMGIDRFVDMARTVVNITGDAVCTLIIAKSENEIGKE